MINQGDRDMRDENNRSKISIENIEKELASAPILKSMLDAAPVALNLWDEDMTNLMCNKHVLKVFQINDEREYLDKFYKFSPEIQPNGVPSLEMAKINFDKAYAEGRYVFHWMHETQDGEKVPSEITLVKLDIESDSEYLVGFIRDLRKDFAQVNEGDYDYYFTDAIPTSIVLNQISSLSSEWFFGVDLRTGNLQQYVDALPIDEINDSALFSLEKVIELGIVHEDDIEKYKKVTENIQKGIFEPYDIRFLSENGGEYRYSRLVYKPIYDQSGTPIYVIGKSTDVHDQKILEERSQKDLLTNCYNKISAEIIVSEKLKTFPDGAHAFFIVDIDNFKSINDNLGHFFGDEVLKEIADGLHAVFREADIIARIGGDEFVVFLENITDLNIIEKKAEKILEVYRKTYSGEYKDYSISGSVGIARYPDNGLSYEELYRNADKALYQAKALGKNRYISYSESLSSGTMSNTTKIDNADRIAGNFFDYELISEVFHILYEQNGDVNSINSALKYIGERYKADRSYIFETLDDGETYDNTFEWCMEGISKEIDNLQGLPNDIFDDIIEKAHNGIIYSNDLRETFEYDAAFETMANQGILSFVHAQVKKEDKMTFFIGLDDCTKTRVWTEREINSLQYIGKLLSVILQGTHLRDKVDTLVEYNKNSTHILDSTDEIVYISDIDTYDLLYLNHTAIQAVGNLEEEVWRSKKCYEILQGKTEPCEFCTNHLLGTGDFYEWSFHNTKLDKTFLLKDKLIPYNGKLARLEIATDVSKMTELERELQEKLEDESFLLDCVERLHSGSEPLFSVYKLLESVVDYYQAERSYIFEVDESGQYASNTFEWCEEGVKSYKQELQEVPLSDIEFLFHRCKTDSAYALHIDDPNMSKDSGEYKLMQFQELQHIVIGSIVSNGRDVTGFVGVDNPKRNADKTLIIQSVAKFVANFLDETEFLAQLNQLSYYDTLTGVKNRQSYIEAIRAVSDIYIESLGVIYIDIRGLGAINDAKGILYGDTILKRLADILTDIFEKDVYRMGGDEFVVYKENMEEHEFEDKIALMKSRLADEEFQTSIGYTWNKNFDANSTNYEHLEGSERYKRILADNLDKEIADGKYVVFLQPQMNLEEDKVRSAEALVRRVGAGGVYQAPFSFIPFYEREGIISKIDLFVFENVCKELKAWKEAGHMQVSSVAINCSRMTIAEEGIVERLSKICEQYGVEKSQIVIEITETTNAISEEVLRDIIQSFADAGFLISLDDFGSGYSNLTSFVMSDFDEVKIDMKLVDDIHTNEKSRALTEVVLFLCAKLDGLVSVAEGIEYEEQYKILKEMGCSKGQGYYFDKPMPMSEFTEKYAK